MTGTKLEISLNAAHIKKRATTVFPGVRGKAKQDMVDIVTGVTIPAGANIIIQPLNAHHPEEKQRFSITSYEVVNSSLASDLLESQRDITTGITYTVEVDTPEKTFIFEEYYQHMNEPLFSKGSPSLDDIQQGVIADCFLLASIQAILNHPQGASFIRGMMQQHEDGTTTVRLFDPNKNQPIYVNLLTAKITDRIGVLNYHKAPWVHILETAYASMGMRAEGSINPSVSSVYSGGGLKQLAMTVLTGLNEEVAFKINLENESTPLSLDDDTFEGVRAIFRMEGILDQEKIDKALKELLEGVLLEITPTQAEGIEGVEPDKVYKDFYQYLKFYINNKDACDKILTSSASEGDKLLELINFVMEAPDTNPNIAKFILMVHNDRMVPVDNSIVRGNAPAFSGFYNEKQIQHYENMEQALANGQLITAGTLTKFKTPVPGLRNQHAYTILKVFSREEHYTDAVTNNVVTRQVRYIQLRNPHGQTGRVYYQKEGTFEFEPIEDPNADIFEIELTDFCNNFNDGSISTTANNLFKHDQQRQVLIDSIKSILTNCQINQNATLLDLNDFKHEYKKYEDKLINLELLHLQAIPEPLRKELEAIFSQELSETEEENAAKSLLEKNPISSYFYVGEQSQQNLHLYHLLKFQWLKSEYPANKSAISTLQNNIVNGAQYDFCSIMKNEKMKLEILASTFARDCTREINELKNEVAQFIHSTQHSEYNVKLVKTILEKSQEFSGKYARILAMKAQLAPLDISIDSEELLELEQQIRILKQAKHLPEARNLVAAFEKETSKLMVKASQFAQTGHISSDEKEKVIELAKLIQCDFDLHPKLSKESKKYNKSKDPTQQELGEQLGKVAKIDQALTGVLKGISKVFSRSEDTAANTYAVGFFKPKTKKDAEIDKPIPPRPE